MTKEEEDLAFMWGLFVTDPWCAKEKGFLEKIPAMKDAYEAYRMAVDSQIIYGCCSLQKGMYDRASALSEAREQGRLEGKKAVAIEMASELKKSNLLSNTQIAEATGLQESEVAALQDLQ